MIDSTSSLLSGLRASQTAIDAAAGNIANARTPGYKRVVVTNSEGPTGGVRATVTRDSSPGPIFVDDLYAALPDNASMGAPNSPTGAGDPGSGGAGPGAGLREGSNIDLAAEMVNMQQAARTFALMARALKTQDDVLGSLLDLFA